MLNIDSAELLSCLMKSDIFNIACAYLKESSLKNWYITAGFIQQVYFNLRHGFEIHYSIKDIDIAYFDDCANSEMNDQETETELGKLIANRVAIDIKNQAFVHLWYKNSFGYDIPPYRNIFDAIDSFPMTSTAIGITDRDGLMSIYSTFGLDDLYNMIVRLNKRQITEEIYDLKKSKIAAKWPMVTIVEWGS
jgi:uncharacterized protein